MPNKDTELVEQAARNMAAANASKEPSDAFAKMTTNIDNLRREMRIVGTGNPLLDLHVSLAQEARELIAKKNRDYGANDDQFRNFRMAALLKIDPEKGVLLRMQDKMARLCTFIDRGDLAVSEESWHDSVVDIINYAVILHGLLNEKVAPKAPQE